VHLTCETIGIRAIVSIAVAVVVRVAVDDVVITAIRTVVLADARVRVFKLMPEAELYASVEII
jgi:hypothetical protein